jgi:hypothetical protein
MSKGVGKLRLREVFTYQPLAEPVIAATEAAKTNRARARVLTRIMRASSSGTTAPAILYPFWGMIKSFD